MSFWSLEMLSVYRIHGVRHRSLRLPKLLLSYSLSRRRHRVEGHWYRRTMARCTSASGLSVCLVHPGDGRNFANMFTRLCQHVHTTFLDQFCSYFNIRCLTEGAVPGSSLRFLQAFYLTFAEVCLRFKREQLSENIL